MYVNELEEFGKLLKDLCVSVDRPFDKDLLSVFWEDLKGVPLQAIQRQAAALRSKGVKRFSSNDLKPPMEEGAGGIATFDNHAIIDRIHAHMLRNIWATLSPYQRLFKHAWVYTRDRAAPRCVALKIEADTIEEMIDGRLVEKHYPGHYIRLEDCDAGFEPSRTDMPLQNRHAPGWNDADAARDLLNRRS